MSRSVIVSPSIERRMERIAEKQLLLEERRLDLQLRQLERGSGGRGCCCCWVPLLPFVPLIAIARWVIRKMKRWLALS